jgi:subtilisin family serine protease
MNHRFLDALASVGPRRHPFADDAGKLPLWVRSAPGTQPGGSGWLPLGAGLTTVRVRPSELAAFEASHPGIHYSVWPPLHLLLDESVKLNRTQIYRDTLAASGSAVAGTGRGVVVGVIDTGIDGQHPDFIDASGHTRIAWLFDLSRTALGAHPELETAFGCNDPNQTACAIESGDDIDAALSGGSAVFVPRDLIGHGTHVASIAAGDDRVTGRYVGGAPEATLVIAAVTRGTSGEVSDPDIANGARFIFDRADAMGMPAVVNLSLGGDFGPHDGSTPLELALAALVGPDHPGHAIVVAAGNSGTLYQGSSASEVLGIHTQLRVSVDATARAPLISPGKKGDPSLSGSAFIWITYGAGDRLSVGLSGPSGIAIAPITPGAQASYKAPSGSFSATVYNGVGEDPTLPLSSNAHGAIVVWDGQWPAASEFALDFVGNGLVDAWVGTQLDTGAADTELFEHALLQGTVNVPATQEDLIAVGCTVNRTHWTDADGFSHDASALTSVGEVLQVDSGCVFSSAGPTATGVSKPEISAPGALVAAAMSHDAAPAPGRASIFDAALGDCPDANSCLVVDAHHALLSGSSMSSPQVAGAVALLLERDPSLTEGAIVELLEEGARRPAGRVFADYQLGGGALDVSGAMAALALAGASAPGVPDASQSWMSLSDGFARPDPGATIQGAVELRASDGSMADDFDPARLTLEVSDSGVVQAPLARTGPGLWHFKVGAKSGTGQNVLTIAVRFDGSALGPSGTKLSGLRVVPIGADRWIAAETATAFGGCAVAKRGPADRFEPWIVAAALTWLARRFRRRQGARATVST